MKDVIINRKKYKAVESWSEMPCTLASKLFAVKMPETLHHYYNAAINGNEVKLKELTEQLTDEDLIKTFPDYYGQVVSVFFGVDVDKIQPGGRTWLYENYCREFIIGLHWTPNFEPANLEYIECENEKLYLPKSKDILGNEVPMAYETAMTFAEASDLQLAHKKFEGGLYEVGANIITILCRPKGEEYDEDTALERAKKLKDVTMDKVFEVFFCSIELLLLQNAQDLRYLLNEGRPKRGWLRRLRDYLSWGGVGAYWNSLKATRALNTSKN